MARFFFAAALQMLLVGTGVAAQEAVLPPGEKEPLLRLEAGGPTSFVTALVFSPDGETLYAAGFDKVVRVWTLDRRSGRFLLDRAAYRVPIGPGLDGAINALAVSSDGTWLAVAGMGTVRGGAGFRRPGLVLPKLGGMNSAMRMDQGLIYVFNTSRAGEVHILRGHLGPVVALAFAPSRPDKPALLVAAAKEWDAKSSKDVGAVRIWDVAAGQQLTDPIWGLPNPEDPPTRPALAVWHSGKQPRQLRVALAWEDGYLRLWEVERTEERLRKLEEGGKYNNTVAYLPRQGKLLTTSFRGQDGQLHLWDVPAHRTPRLEGRIAFAPPEKSVYYFPAALAPFSARAGGELDSAAVVLRVYRPGDGQKRLPDDFVLDLLDLQSRKRQARGPISLWTGGEKLPVLAATPGGRYLAVAGNFKDHEIRLYAIQELLRNQGEPQKLRSAGTTFRYVAFARRGKALGLVLSERGKDRPGAPARPPGATDLIFDFTKRALTAPSSGWEVAAPAAKAWNVEHRPAAKDDRGNVQPALLAVRHDGKLVRQIPLPAKNVYDIVIADYALLPPQPPLQLPILALALRDKDEPKLLLYNAASGEQLRQYTGHTDQIRCLAFSPDGKLLASVADDQTIRVWSLVHLDKILNEWGMLPGVAVKEGQTPGGPPVVGRIEPTSPARGKLREEEVIEGLVEGDRLAPLYSARAFYDALAAIKPGRQVVLRVRNLQGQRRDVRLTVGQAVDDRKPLLSLFITQSDQAQARRWVGWNPYGPYEASTRAAERLIGWHFNTGDPRTPASFAFADQYRKGRYREGILKHLVAQGSLSPALRAWEEEENRKPLPEPNMTLEIDDLGPAPEKDRHGQIFLRRPPRKLTLALDNGLPADRIEAVQWQVDGGALQEFTQLFGRERSVDLGGLRLRPGVHKFRVLVRTRAAEPKEYARELTLRYQPPPPALEFDAAWLKKYFGAAPPARLVLQAQPKFLIKAAARPGLTGQEVQVTFRQGKKPPERLGSTIEKEIELQEGDNRIELEAQNRQALPGYEEYETARKTLLITYLPAKAVPPPQLTLEVRALPPGGAEARPVLVEPGRPVIVSEPRIRVQVKITARENLTEARRDHGALPGFQANAQKQFSTAEEFTLAPGKREFTYLAKAAGSPSAQVGLTVEYRPRLPKVVLTAPSQGAVFYEGQDPRRLSLEAQLLDPPRHRQPYKAVVLVNDQEAADPPTLDSTSQTLTARITLGNGDNRIQVRLTNAWGAVEVSDELQVRYLRPPRDIQFEKPRLGQKPLIDLVAHVSSPLPLLRASVRAEVNGRGITTFELPEQPAGTQTWKVLLKDVPLDAGDNEIHLWVSNREAQCRQPGILKILYQPTLPLTRPEVTILDPANDVNVTDPEPRLRFRIKSTTPLKQVELVREGYVPVRQPFDPSRLTRNAQGFYEAKVEVRLLARDGPLPPNAAVDLSVLKANAEGFAELPLNLRLLARENRLRIEAVNEAGAAQASVVINYIHMPVRLVIDELQCKGSGAIQPKAAPGGQLSVPPLPDGRIRLRGRVLWSKENDEQLKQISWVRVYANGFQQVPAPLELPAARTRERPFTADILLNRSRGNYLEIDLPDNSLEAGARPRLEVDCLNPVQEQRLHLLIVGIGDKDEALLLARAQQALETHAFTDIHLYGPLTGYVSPQQIFTQLCLIKKTIDVSARAGAVNDVVMVYYQGSESLAAGNHFLLTSASRSKRNLEWSAVSCDGLADLFADTLGAHLLLLDVTREGTPDDSVKDRIVHWPEEVRAGVFRAAWLRRVGQVPEEARLISAWGETTPQVSRLQEVDRRVTDRFSRLAARYQDKLLVYDGHLPLSLADLTVGQAP